MVNAPVSIGAGGRQDQAEGERDGVRRAELIHERWHGGRLVERTFSRVGGAATADERPGAIAITYAGEGPSGLAAHITLRNARLGYQLGIETVALQ